MPAKPRQAHAAAAHEGALAQALADPAVDLRTIERDKIKGAIRTDFILSAEIIVIALGTVATQPLAARAAGLVAIALLMTVGVYGLVAGIVKLDDGGLALARVQGMHAWARARRACGRGILAAAPWLMKGLSVAGTIAMFLVGGGILVHGLPVAHHAIEHALAGAAPWWQTIAPHLADLVVGVVAGALALGVVWLAQRLWRTRAAPTG